MTVKQQIKPHKVTRSSKNNIFPKNLNSQQTSRSFLYSIDDSCGPP